MEYQVPQFIEVENKIVGSLTLKQFIYVAGGGGLCIVFFVYFSKVVAILLSIPVIALAGALSFYKINGKPFVELLEAGFTYYTRSKLFLWKHEDSAPPSTTSSAEPASLVQKKISRLTRGKLSELAWSLDTPQDPKS
jgi:hypothetical protein